MILNYTKTEYEEKIEYLKTNGYTVTNFNIDYDSFESSEDEKSMSAEFQLPDGAKSYKDFSAIIAWGSYFENDDTTTEQQYSGVSIPDVFCADNDGDPATVTYELEDLTTEGNVKITISFKDTPVLKNNLFGYFINNLKCLTFISNDGCSMSADKTVVFPSLKTFFDQATTQQVIQLSLEGKTRFLSLGDDECFCIDSAYKCYGIESCDQTGKKRKIMFDGECYYTESSMLKLRLYQKTTMVGFTAEDIVNADILAAANENITNFKNDVTNCINGCLYLGEGLIYPISDTLPLKSHLRIVGNGSTIMAYEESNSTSISMISHYGEDNITDVTFEDLTFRGRMNLSGNGVDDQGVKVNTIYTQLTNFRFENVKFEGFSFAVHFTNNTLTKIPEWNWSFNNCEFVKAQIPIMLTATNGLKITNSHIDASLSTVKGQHCVYISRLCSNITIDNCLLENAMGAAILQNYAGTITDNDYIYDNSFTNLQIRNCNMAVIIGSPSKNILVENIVATNVLRGLELENCLNVTVNNFNVSNSFYYTNFRKAENETTKFSVSESGWAAIIIKGYVSATINNSYFSTGNVWFYSAKTSYLTTNFDYRVVSCNLIFNNCIFESTFSEYRPGSVAGSFYEPESYLGVETSRPNSENEVVKEFYYYSVDFNDCQFHMNLDGRTKQMITLKGYPDFKSYFNFNNCLIAYRYGKGNESADAVLPDGYFIYPDSGTLASFTDCLFYTDPENKGAKSLRYGFVRDNVLVLPNATEEEYNVGIEENTIRCIVTSETEDFIRTL